MKLNHKPMNNMPQFYTHLEWILLFLPLEICFDQLVVAQTASCGCQTWVFKKFFLFPFSLSESCCHSEAWVILLENETCGYVLFVSLPVNK